MDNPGGGASVDWAQWRPELARAFRYFLDRSTPYATVRWLVTLALAASYVLRVYYLQGFFMVSYGVGIYVLNLLVEFISPKSDPELDMLDGSALPIKLSDEFRPFVRRLPEFKFWFAVTKALCIAFVMTFFVVFDIPAYWPLLVLYWSIFFVLIMKRQIHQMIKYKYVPFDIGKKRYVGMKSHTHASRDGLD